MMPRQMAGRSENPSKDFQLRAEHKPRAGLRETYHELKFNTRVRKVLGAPRSVLRRCGILFSSS